MKALPPWADNGDCGNCGHAFAEHGRDDDGADACNAGRVSVCVCVAYVPRELYLATVDAEITRQLAGRL